MRGRIEYMSVITGEPTLLSMVLEIIKGRSKEKSEGWVDVAAAYKVLTVSAFGATTSKHGIISSKTYAKVVKYCAGYNLRLMIASINECGFDVISGDTALIFTT